MKKISHTPTPWEVVTYEHSIFGETTFDYGIISTIAEIPICNLDPTYNDTLTSEVCKENAEFICKAVNEYDKLKEDNAAMLNILQRINNVISIPAVSKVFSHDLQIAIKKATKQAENK